MIRAVFVSLLLVCATLSPVSAQDFEKGWIDVNFGGATAAQDGFSSTLVTILDLEPAVGSVAYSLPRGASFDVGGGYLFSPRFGIGVSLAGTAHEEVAGLAISVPHPRFFDASAIDATVTDTPLTRVEGAWHVQGVFVALATPRVRVRLFGGPSYFAAEQEVVTRISYDQDYQIFGRGNIVDITMFRGEVAEGSGWGGHVGADVAFFFNRIVGLGGVVRVSQGSVEIDDYGGAHDIDTGGVQFGGGLRLKF